MKILNYKWCAFSVIEEENFYIAYFNYIDYNWDIREVCITRQNIWSKTIYIATYSWLTTEYTGWLREVMDKVIKQYKSEEIKQ